MNRNIYYCQTVAFLFFILSSNLLSWGPHSEITKAALDVLPCAEKIKSVAGENNFSILPRYSLMSDELCQDLTEFYVDDYLLSRYLPRYIEHRMPEVRQGITPHFRRVLQAFRTETYSEVCRQLGPLLHYVEDMGAPPHAMPVYGPEHGPMENWVNIEKINISGYQPVLLGKTEEEALSGLLNRLDRLTAFTVERAEKIFPLVKKGESERSNVEPVVLECALETARVVSDMLYTVFTIGLSYRKDEGAVLKGTVSFSEFPFHKEKGARIILLDNIQYSKLSGKEPEEKVIYLSATNYTTHTDKEGHYEFYNLPEGEYRILVERTGSRTAISEPVKLEKGKTSNLNISLLPSNPPRNFVRNGDFKLYYLSKDMPDWWFKKTSWMYPGVYPTSAIIHIPSKTSFRCGAIKKDTDVKISFQFRETLWGNPLTTLTLQKGQTEEEVFYQTKDKDMFAVVVIETEKPLKEVVERVWISETTLDKRKVEISKDSGSEKAESVSNRDSGLLIHFKFDEGAGNSVKDSAGGCIGNISGNFSWVEGKEGYAISFNGMDTKLMVSGTEALSSSVVTLSAWIKTTSKTPGTIVEKWKSNTEPGYRLSYVPPNINMVIYYTGGSKTISGKIPVDDGQWHYVAGTYNGKEMKIYIDGKEVYSEPLGQDISKGNNASITIGYREWQGGSSFFNGVIDEVKIYNRNFFLDSELSALLEKFSQMLKDVTPSSPASKEKKENFLKKITEAEEVLLSGSDEKKEITLNAMKSLIPEIQKLQIEALIEN